MAACKKCGETYSVWTAKHLTAGWCNKCGEEAIAADAQGTPLENAPLSVQMAVNTAAANREQAAAAKEAAAAAEEERSKFRQRLRVERIAFLAVATVAMGVVAQLGALPRGMVEGVGGPFAVAGLFAVLANGAHMAQRYFLGSGGYFERLPRETVVPRFDWKRLLLEPLYLLLAVGCVVLMVAVTGLVQWAMKGNGH